MLASYLFYKMAVSSSTLSEKILCWIAVYFFLYLLLAILLTTVKKKFVTYIMNVLGFPILLIMLAQHYLAPIFTIIMFVGFYIVPTALILNLSNFYGFLTPYLGGIIYLVNVITVLVFAYFGNKIMELIINTFKTTFIKNVLDKYSTVFYTRTYTYVLMVIIYIIFNFISFSKEDLFSFLPIEPVSVIKEVFVTFVAVDTLIQILLNKKQQK